MNADAKYLINSSPTSLPTSSNSLFILEQSHLLPLVFNICMKRCANFFDQNPNDISWPRLLLLIVCLSSVSTPALQMLEIQRGNMPLAY